MVLVSATCILQAVPWSLRPPYPYFALVLHLPWLFNSANLCIVPADPPQPSPGTPQEPLHLHIPYPSPLRSRRTPIDPHVRNGFYILSPEIFLGETPEIWTNVRRLVTRLYHLLLKFECRGRIFSSWVRTTSDSRFGDRRYSYLDCVSLWYRAGRTISNTFNRLLLVWLWAWTVSYARFCDDFPGFNTWHKALWVNPYQQVALTYCADFENRFGLLALVLFSIFAYNVAPKIRGTIFLAAGPFFITLSIYAVYMVAVIFGSPVRHVLEGLGNMCSPAPASRHWCWNPPLA